MSLPGDAVAAHFAADLPVWNADDDGALVCRRVVQETHDVRSFYFSAEAPRRFLFKPGQFLTFEFEIAGEILYRCYTISSPPTQPYLISITVKRHPGGPVSNFLHDHLRPGVAVRATGPMGDFTTASRPADKYLFLSGGSGITPLMCMARSFAGIGTNADVAFVHSARSPEDIIFRDELARMGRDMPGFRAVAVCESDSPGEIWGGFRGRLSLDRLRLMAPDFSERTVFTCGPAPYMAGVRAMLAASGFDMARYYEESFVFEDIVGPVAAESIAAARGYRVSFSKSGRTIDCSADDFVLRAATASGLKIASSCTRGMCGTCKSRLVSGQVEMRHNGGIRQREIDQGMILICCSRPLSDLVIDR
jgi:ferredoxin-NADP reductase